MKHENLVSSKEWIKVKLPPQKIWKADVLSVGPLSELCGPYLLTSDGGIN